jgi:hypothetical protein
MDTRKSGECPPFALLNIVYISKTGPRRNNGASEPVKPVVDARPEGWLSQLGRLAKMSDAEMDEWSSEDKKYG